MFGVRLLVLFYYKISDSIALSLYSCSYHLGVSFSDIYIKEKTAGSLRRTILKATCKTLSKKKGLVLVLCLDSLLTSLLLNPLMLILSFTS